MTVRHYRLFGLAIASDLPLPELAQSDGNEAPGITIVTAAVESSTGSSHHPQPVAGGATLAIDGVARFAILRGKTILVDPDPSADPRTVRLYLLGSAMGMLLHQRGILPLHANAIEVDGLAYAFMGQSGAGKSTLAAWFHDRGHGLIADDVCAILFADDGRPHAQPGLPRLRLWRDALERTGRTADDWPRSHVNEKHEKFDVSLTDAATASRAIPMAAVYLLEQAPLLGIERLHGVAATDALFANTYRGAFVDLASSAADHFSNCIRLVQSTPVFRFRRPFGDQLMDIQGATLLRHFASLHTG